MWCMPSCWWVHLLFIADSKSVKTNAAAISHCIEVGSIPRRLLVKTRERWPSASFLYSLLENLNCINLTNHRHLLLLITDDVIKCSTASEPCFTAQFWIFCYVHLLSIRVQTMENCMRFLFRLNLNRQASVCVAWRLTSASCVCSNW